MEAKEQYIIYFRVSTDKQFDKGDMVRQIEPVRRFLELQGIIISATVKDFAQAVREGRKPKNYPNIYYDVMSGGKAHRPGLEKAIETCKKEKKTLLIPRIDRLTRELSLLERLEKEKVDFLCASNTEINSRTSAGSLMGGIMSTLAKYERKLISERTKRALDRKKELAELNGELLLLGARNPDIRKGLEKDYEARKLRKKERLKELKITVLPFIRKGWTYMQIAGHLNSKGYVGVRGGKLNTSQISQAVHVHNE